MGRTGYFTAAGALALVAAIGLTLLLTMGDSHAPGKVVTVAEPPVHPSVSPSPRLKKLKRRPARTVTTKGPLSTTAPRGTGLGAPDHLTAEPRYGTVTLRWYAVAHAAGYVIYRDGQNVGQTTGLLFDDTGLRNGQRHSWTVAALDSANTPGDRSEAYVGTALG